jgi:hypothetical protein
MVILFMFTALVSHLSRRLSPRRACHTAFGGLFGLVHVIQRHGHISQIREAMSTTYFSKGASGLGGTLLAFLWLSAALQVWVGE